MRLDQVMDTVDGQALASTYVAYILRFFIGVFIFFIQKIVRARCFQKTGGCALCWQLARAKIVCDWRPVAYKLYPSGRQFFASMLREQLFELKIEDAIKKSKNPRDTCPC
jgi:hypothetical protein